MIPSFRHSKYVHRPEHDAPMNESTSTATRYLLGELLESDQSAFEERFFSDPRAFEEVEAAETALVDDYVRGRLPVDVRRRFEQTYLADPRRRDRVRFAAALAARVDQSGAAPPSGHGRRRRLGPDSQPASGWPSWIAVSWPLQARPGLAVAAVLLAATGIWLASQLGRGREDSAPVAGGRAGQERPAGAADAGERARAPEVERPSPGPAAPPLPATRSSPKGPVTPTFATLIIAVGGGERGQDGGRPPTLVIAPTTSDVRIQLRLREHEHASYQIVLRAIGGPEILRRANLRPATEAAGPVLTLTVPASRFSAGDYMLTLQGAAGGSEFDDVSLSLFRVDRP